LGEKLGDWRGVNYLLLSLWLFLAHELNCFARKLAENDPPGIHVFPVILEAHKQQLRRVAIDWDDRSDLELTH